MDWYTLCQFVLATLVLLVTPGPIMAIIARNTLRRGSTAGFLTVVGIEIGDACLLAAVFAGLAFSGELLAATFRWLSLAGALYLIWLAVRALSAPDRMSRETASSRCRRPILDGLAIVFANPSRLVFYTAFFPQFIDPSRPITEQMIALSALYACTVLSFECLYVLTVARLRLPTHRLRVGRLAEVGSAAVYLVTAFITLSTFLGMS